MSVIWNASPVSMTELGIYLDWRKNLQGTAYNIPFLFPLPEETDGDRLENALAQTLRAHPNLLSHFRMAADGSVSRLTPAAEDGEIPVTIRRETGEPDLKKLVRPFSDPEGDLYRLHIILGKDRAYLFVDIHHILYDGSSTPVFIGELNRAYAGESLAGEAVSAADFARAEQEARKTEAFAQAEAWYEGLLSDAEISSAPLHDREGGEQKNAYIIWPLGLDGGEVAGYVKRLGIRTSAFFTGVYGYC